MNERLRRWVFDLRVLGAVTGVLGLAIVLLAVRWNGQRADVRDADVAIASLQAEILDLESNLERVRREREALPPEERGHGPGGIRCDVERFYFEGPTAARAALELTTAADESGFHHLRYAGEATKVPGRFPPDSDGMDDEEGAVALPVRHRIRLVRWPVEFQIESSYGSAVDLMGSLTRAEPAFAVEHLRLEAKRDGNGRVEDRLIVTGSLASHWFETEE